MTCDACQQTIIQTSAELALLRAELASLREQVAALSPPPTTVLQTFGRGEQGVAARAAGGAQGLAAEASTSTGARPGFDRRALLGRLTAASVAGLGVAAFSAAPAQAGVDGDVVLGDVNDAGLNRTEIASSNATGTFTAFTSGQGYGSLGQSSLGPGARGQSAYANGVEGTASAVVNQFNGVYGLTHGVGNGVFGECDYESNTGNALLGINKGPGNCVFGFKPEGVAGDAVVGWSRSGRGVLAISGSSDAVRATTGSGTGLSATSDTGRGGSFAGAKAQIRLVPSSKVTHPASGREGDLFLDRSMRLWLCKGSTTWVRLA